MEGSFNVRPMLMADVQGFNYFEGICSFLEASGS